MPRLILFALLYPSFVFFSYTLSALSAMFFGVLSRLKKLANKHILSICFEICVFKLFVYLMQDCNGEANCVIISCPLQDLDSKASVVLRSRLWNSTFLEVSFMIVFRYRFVSPVYIGSNTKHTFCSFSPCTRNILNSTM